MSTAQGCKGCGSPDNEPLPKSYPCGEAFAWPRFTAEGLHDGGTVPYWRSAATILGVALIALALILLLFVATRR